MAIPSISGQLRLTLAVAVVSLGVGCAHPPASPGPAGLEGVPRPSYASDELWLCRPGRQDACAVDLTATVIAPDGRRTREEWSANPDAPIDCFYVYPTVSLDPTPHSDLQPGPEERRAVALQLARFGSQCRLFAPMYRQVTLKGLREAMEAKRAPDWAVPYGDVAEAWKHYLEHDNRGRGVVLIGHSQGSRLLLQLLRREIEPTPARERIVSALLLGTAYPPPRPGDPPERLPTCTSPTQVGCVISYASFRASSPPPADALFGRGPGGSEVACTNPAALGGGPGGLDAYFATDRLLIGAPAPYAWTSDGGAITTPFVRVPGLLEATCITRDGASYLAISVRREPGGRRSGDIPGDVVWQGRILPSWGLHLVDLDVAQGTLVEVVRQQARSYLARPGGAGSRRP